MIEEDVLDGSWLALGAAGILVAASSLKRGDRGSASRTKPAFYSPVIRIQGSDVIREDGSVLRPVAWHGGAPLYTEDVTPSRLQKSMERALRMPLLLSVGSRQYAGLGWRGDDPKSKKLILLRDDFFRDRWLPPSAAAREILHRHGPQQVQRGLAHAGFRL